MRYFLILLLVIQVSGCGSINKFDYQNGQIMTANVGSTMIRWTQGSQFGLAKYGKEMELVYSGKTDSTLRLSYREYVYDRTVLLARPAFSQDLTYDLKISKQIAFQDILLEVQDADNSKVTFKVVKAMTFAK